ncbi:MAG: hydroxyacylglutathione hydrolase [Myxococcota bacterium]
MHAVQTLTPPLRSRSGDLVVHQIPAWQDNFIYLLVHQPSGACAAVDGPEATPALDKAKTLGLSLDTIFNTHTHFDHIGINRDLLEKGRRLRRVVGARKKASEVPGLTEAVEDGSQVDFGGLLGDVMLTEGHIDGHVCFLFEDLLFSGDTLFAGGCGYLFDGPPAKMHASLQRLAQLDPDTKVLCAHEYTQDNLRFAWSVEPGNPALAERIRQVWALRAEGKATVPTTIGLERATNPFVRSDSAEIKARVEAALGRRLSSQEEVFAATRELKDRKDYREQGDDQLPLER